MSWLGFRKHKPRITVVVESENNAIRLDIEHGPVIVNLVTRDMYKQFSLTGGDEFKLTFARESE